MHAGIIPVKDLRSAKARLADRFDERARLEIARALLLDTLELCARTEFLQWSIVSSDPEVATAARARGMAVLDDPGTGLNAALGAALAHVGAQGAESATVIPADVPLARPEDLLDILDTGESSDVIVVPSLRDGGTNALHVRPATIAEPRFGPGSLAHHVAYADERGLRCTILELDRLALDVDTGDDIDELQRRDQDSRTLQAIARLTS